MRYLIRALPPSYSYIGDFIDVIPEDQRTVDYVKSKIKEKNYAKNDSDKKSNVSTFTAKFEGKCYNCGKVGHYKNACTRPPQQSNRGRGAQSSQGQRGHQRGYNRGGNSRGRDRGRGQGQPRGDFSSEQQGNYSSESWTTQKNLMMKKIEIWKIANLKIKEMKY
ncbi:ubiquitin-associated protein 2-like [Nasonia vitripennis]|uniref:CCHC-type domain-containing protein n=1 Tax=Nasonia vitripennis TaxID=7425 RepID=A0A7M7Q693_NASVI|nr:ubiquitin-associated protein 2-like [Nasonia vitripennis]